VRDFIASLRATNPDALDQVADAWLYLALCEKDRAAAEESLRRLDSAGCQTESLPIPRPWCEALVANLAGDPVTAAALFSRAAEEAERNVDDAASNPQALCVLGLARAGVGLKDQAVESGRRACELLPIDKDALDGVLLAEYLAVIYSLVGETDLAIAQLELITSRPGYVSYGNLKLHPYWDSLRGNPRFEQIVASLAPRHNAEH
jgi:tetratricopeptide (TPR) repeat protein